MSLACAADVVSFGGADGGEQGCAASSSEEEQGGGLSLRHASASTNMGSKGRCETLEQWSTVNSGSECFAPSALHIHAGRQPVSLALTSRPTHRTRGPKGCRATVAWTRPWPQDLVLERSSTSGRSAARLCPCPGPAPHLHQHYLRRHHHRTWTS